MDSQDLQNYQWKNRIVLVLSDDSGSDKFIQQIADLKKASQGCAERKLVMYQFIPNEVHSNSFDGAESKKWTSASDLYTKFMKKGDDFKFVLIGLDGSVKEKRTEPMPTQELFDIIDGMSMRQAEMRKQD